ncbi:efflux RND transporter permease subunit [Oligoflexia bacterium]|nr:efflux RND transporter permease subunit [Oligoflexia bacterium]
MSLPEIAIKRPVLTVMMNLLLVLSGLVALQSLPVRELPDIDPPIVSVLTVYPGANAAVVETEVTERLEEVINGVEGIKTLTSRSRDEVSNIMVRFDLTRDIDLAAQDVRDRVSRVRGGLPEDIEDPVVAKQDSDAEPMMWIALNSDRHSVLELTKIADTYLKDTLQTVRGVSSVIFGGEKRLAFRLHLDPKRMAAHGVVVSDIAQALKAQNVELPSGRVENRERELTIQVLGELKSAEEFNELIVRKDGDTLVRLRDVGMATVGVEDERVIGRYNGKDAIGLGVVRQAKANTVSVAEGVKQVLEERRPFLPQGVRALVAYDKSTFIEASINQVWQTLFVAFVLVVFTIFAFLRNVRSTIVPSLTIPIATIGTFSVLMLMGYSINILTLLGLVLAIGIVVDDSIVVLENIYRHIEDGLSPREAAFKGMEEIVFVVIATTVALLAVFLPLAYQTTVAGRLFIEFALALSGAVVISSFIALTLTPMACSRLLRPAKDVKHGRFFEWTENFFNALALRYTKGLDRVLARRKLIVSVACLSLFASFLLYSWLDKEFLPEEDKGYLLSLVIAPEGSTPEYTDRMIRKIEKISSETPEVQGIFSAVALPFNGPGEAKMGFAFMTLKDDRSRGLADIIGGPHGLGARFFGEIEGALAFPIMPKAVEFGFSQPFQLVVQHSDIEQLDEFSQKFTQILRLEGVLQNLQSSFQLNKPQLRIDIERNRAAALGVSIEEISRTLQILFGGIDVSKIKLAGEEYDVLLQLDREKRLKPDDLNDIYVRGSGGNLVQLTNVVSHKTFAGPNAIEHYDRMRSTTIEGTPVGVSMGALVERVEILLEEHLPEGFSYKWTGEAEDLKEATSNTAFVALLALLVIYIVLAAQYESLVHPFTVMLALPLGLFGGLGGLWLLDKINDVAVMFYGWANYAPDPPLFAKVVSWLLPRIPSMSVNLFSQIGMVLLFGLVTKNSILLVDFANQARARGLSAVAAMREAGAIRFRPILMTAFATIIGIMPIAIGFGAGAESRRPMGVVVVAGMAVSTFLTLFVVPVVYVMLAEFFEKLQAKRGVDDHVS